MNVRFSNRIQLFLSGTQAWADMRAGRLEDPDAQLMSRIRMAPERKDGSVTIEVSCSDLDYLESAIGGFEAGSADNIGYDDEGNDALADLNAARGMLRQIANLKRETIK